MKYLLWNLDVIHKKVLSIALPLLEEILCVLRNGCNSTFCDLRE